MKVSELKFKPHSAGIGGTMARATFDNGYGASVITGEPFYTRSDAPYEMAILDKEGALTYDTPITGDVLGYLTEDDVNKYLADVEALPSA